MLESSATNCVEFPHLTLAALIACEICDGIITFQVALKEFSKDCELWSQNFLEITLLLERFLNNFQIILILPQNDFDISLELPWSEFQASTIWLSNDLNLF